MANKYPYKECELCKGLENCPAVVVLEDGFGSPVPPPECPNGTEIVEKIKKRKDAV